MDQSSHLGLVTHNIVLLKPLGMFPVTARRRGYEPFESAGTQSSNVLKPASKTVVHLIELRGKGRWGDAEIGQKDTN